MARLPVVKEHYGRVPNYVNGEWVESRSTRVQEVVDPALCRPIAEVPMSGRAEVEDAISAAAEAFQDWADTPPNIRVQPLYRLKVLFEEHYEEIASILVQEHGKVIDEARGSVRRTIDNLEFACGIPSLLMGETLVNGAAAGIDEEAVREPLGVCACIAPFNFPAMVPFWFWPTAVACGNTFVVKPSEQVPLTQARIFQLIEEAGFPEGVINMVQGDREVSDTFLTDPRVRAVSFVGSTPIARYVYSTAAANGKRVQCQGGAKNFIAVMPDANLDTAITNLVATYFGNTGQRCLAGAVLVPVGDRGGEVVDRFVAAASRLRLGNGLDESAQLGPVAAKRHFDRVMGYIDKGVAEGGKLLLDGRHPKVDGHPEGYFIGPTVFDGMRQDMTLVREEIFGPVVSIVRVPTLDAAIELANTSAFGNASSIYTSSGRASREYRTRVRGGNLGINVGVAAPMAYFPFGGMKDSFFGDLHGQGRDGVNFFTDRRVVITRWI